MPDNLEVVLLSLAWAAPVVLLGLIALWLLRGKSITAHVSIIVLIAVLSVISGVIGVSYAMFLSPHDRGVVLLVVGVAGAVALVSALVIGRRLGRQSVWEREAIGRERALEQSRRDLVAWVSHDLRTPLAALRAMAEALEDGLISVPEQQRAYFHQIRTETDRLARMVDDLFELSRIHAGALSLHFDAVPLADVVSDVVATVSPTAQAKRVLIRAEAMTWPVVRASDGELSRVIYNLLANAIRHTPTDGAVVVAGGTDDQGPWFAVRDACGGIPPQDLPRVFDVAFRGAAERPPDSGGGLGLAIARGLVEAHHGTIGVVNVAGGCQFVVRLPAPNPS